MQNTYLKIFLMNSALGMHVLCAADAASPSDASTVPAPALMQEGFFNAVRSMSYPDLDEDVLTALRKVPSDEYQNFLQGLREINIDSTYPGFQKYLIINFTKVEPGNYTPFAQTLRALIAVENEILIDPASNYDMRKAAGFRQVALSNQLALYPHNFYNPNFAEAVMAATEIEPFEMRLGSMNVTINSQDYILRLNAIDLISCVKPELYPVMVEFISKNPQYCYRNFLGNSILSEIRNATTEDELKAILETLKVA
ncbi:MAG: hypothetical protein Q8K36_05310 [Alphaproteobacteria bacterium]|nr:hypothetical protein [Alphaproteobacteria bacterium]